MMIFIVLLQMHFLYADDTKYSCLHRGCELSAGLPPEDLDLYIRNLLSDPKYEDNILRFISWDIGEDGNRRKLKNMQSEREQFCKMISRTSPVIVGLQDMDSDQNENFKPCLTQYIYAGSKIRKNSRQRINGLYIKKERRLRVIKTGTFTLNKDPFSVPSRTCAWAKMRFAERKNAPSFYLSGTKNSKVFMKIFRLLKAFSGKNNNKSKRYRPKRLRQQRISYQWFDFYVAVAKLNPYNERDAKRQLHTLIRHLKNRVMDRRRYPIVLMADFGWEYNSTVFNLIKRSNWLSNTFLTSFGKYPAVTLLNDYLTDDGSLVDFIFENRFKSVLTATITNNNDIVPSVFRHRPVFSALIRQSK